MADFVMLMKDPGADGDWEAYVGRLQATGRFRGGSSLGAGVCVRKGHPDSACSVTGILRIEADDLEQVRALLVGNPAWEAGHPVELLEEIPD